jgi:bifunctional DNase/RNase
MFHQIVTNTKVTTVSKVQVEIIGISTSPSSNGAYALILQESNGQRRLPIVIGAFEAQAIALEMEGIRPPRPMTHDLMKSTIESLGATLVEVVINDLNDGTFYAQLILDNTGVEIDSRPSDAIALAVRFQAPIFVSDEVLNDAGFVAEGDLAGEADDDDDEEDEILRSSRQSEPPEQKITKEERNAEPLSKLEILKQELEKAIAQEDYEKAAILRDEITQLSNH